MARTQSRTKVQKTKPSKKTGTKKGKKIVKKQEPKTKTTFAEKRSKKGTDFDVERMQNMHKLAIKAGNI